MNKIVNIIIGVICIAFVLTSCKGDKKAFVSTFTTNSPLNLYNVFRINVVNDRLYVMSEIKHQQILSSYNIDLDNKMLTFQKEYFKRDSATYDFYFFTPLWDNNDSLFIVESDNPVLWEQVNDSIVQTDKALLSTTAKVPHAVALHVRRAFYVSDNEYIFVGRQPRDGEGAIYRSVIDNGETIVTEITPLIADEKYQSWVVNHGTLTYNNSIKKGAFAYWMFPKIKIFDYTNKTEKTISLGESTFNPETIEEGDLWYINTVNFIDIVSTDEYIYALYWGNTFEGMDKDNKEGKAVTRICKFDWNGNLEKSYKIKRALKNIAVTKDGKSIIGYDGENFVLIAL